MLNVDAEKTIALYLGPFVGRSISHSLQHTLVGRIIIGLKDYKKQKDTAAFRERKELENKRVKRNREQRKMTKPESSC